MQHAHQDAVGRLLRYVAGGKVLMEAAVEPLDHGAARGQFLVGGAEHLAEALVVDPAVAQVVAVADGGRGGASHDAGKEAGLFDVLIDAAEVVAALEALHGDRDVELVPSAGGTKAGDRVVERFQQLGALIPTQAFLQGLQRIVVVQQRDAEGDAVAGEELLWIEQRLLHRAQGCQALLHAHGGEDAAGGEGGEFSGNLAEAEELVLLEGVAERHPVLGGGRVAAGGEEEQDIAGGSERARCGVEQDRAVAIGAAQGEGEGVAVRGGAEPAGEVWVGRVASDREGAIAAGDGVADGGA